MQRMHTQMERHLEIHWPLLHYNKVKLYHTQRIAFFWVHLNCNNLISLCQPCRRRVVFNRPPTQQHHQLFRQVYRKLEQLLLHLQPLLTTQHRQQVNHTNNLQHFVSLFSCNMKDMQFKNSKLYPRKNFFLFPLKYTCNIFWLMSELKFYEIFNILFLTCDSIVSKCWFIVKLCNRAKISCCAFLHTSI